MPKYNLDKFQQFGKDNNYALELTKDQFIEFITYLHQNSNFKWFNFELGPQPLLSNEIPIEDLVKYTFDNSEYSTVSIINDNGILTTTKPSAFFINNKPLSDILIED
jgi:hypothetical protein